MTTQQIKKARARMVDTYDAAIKIREILDALKAAHGAEAAEKALELVTEDEDE